MKAVKAGIAALALGYGGGGLGSGADCEVEAYYAGLSLPSRPDASGAAIRAALLARIEAPHAVVPRDPSLEAPDRDAWTALAALDAIDDDQLRLVYRGEPFPRGAAALNARGGWAPAHVWPGLTLPQAAADLHALRAADPRVADARGLRALAECAGTSPCIRTPPLTPLPDGKEAPQLAEALAMGATTLQPAALSRGELARALLYMAVRYEHQLGLRLTDCPDAAGDRVAAASGADSGADPGADPAVTAAVAALQGARSALLAWHEEFPVTDRERLRNTAVCQHWQANRNPFVDRPDLARLAFPKAADADCDPGDRGDLPQQNDEEEEEEDQLPVPVRGPGAPEQEAAPPAAGVAVAGAAAAAVAVAAVALAARSRRQQMARAALA